jgi:hypothetical protein
MRVIRRHQIEAMPRRNMAICKLCDKNKRLIKAHIIPEPFFGDRNDLKLVAQAKGAYPRRIPIGVYDTNILCADCDGAIGRLDQHAAEALLQGKSEGLRHPCSTLVARRYPNADGLKLHRFIISVAWRASVSSHDYFNRVKLGKYESLIRGALLDDASDAAPLQTFLGEFEGKHVVPLDPHWTRFDDVRVWVIYAGRFIFYMKADRKPIPRDFSIYVLKSAHPVYSVVRQWDESKEKQLALGIVRANPSTFRRPAGLPHGRRSQHPASLTPRR